MRFTFQTTDGRMFFTDAEPKAISDYWKRNKRSIKWCIAKFDSEQLFIWHEGHKGWQHFPRLDEKAQAVYRRLIKKYYMEAYENGVVMEYVGSLDNQN